MDSESLEVYPLLARRRPVAAVELPLDLAAPHVGRSAGSRSAGVRQTAGSDLSLRCHRPSRYHGAMDLVEVHFVTAGKSVFVQPGTTLLAAAEMAGVELLTGCTRGMCGTDAVRLAATPSAMEPAEAMEAGTLQRMGVGADCRLACSARVATGVIAVLGDALIS